MKNLILILLATFTLNSQAQVSPYIIGGQEVAASDPVAQRTVLVAGKILRASFTCTGVVYSPTLILTAGHCLGAPGWADLTIHFKTNKNGSGSAIKVIDQIRIRDIPTGSPTYDWDDIALLKLASPIPAGYVPTQLMSDSSSLKNGDAVVLAGYGRTTVGPPSSGDGGMGILRKVDQKILEILYGKTEVLIDIRERGACSGDSGGPAFVVRNGEYFLLGLASRLTEHNIDVDSNPIRYDCKFDLVYTKISAHMDWILKTAAQMQ